MRPLLPLSLLLALACTDPDTDTTTVTDTQTTNETGVTDTGEGPTTTRPDVDSDRDGLLDGVEADLGTDPNNPDTDDDDLSDGLEVNVHRTDPLDPDTDDDNLNDGAEIDEGTLPLNPDTDDDGLLDGDEVSSGTNPLKQDTDDDGILDGEEPKINLDPTNWDTDGDGLPDGMEHLNLGTDPLLIDTDGDTISDFDEHFVYGSDPLLADTDGDKLTDDLELAYGSDFHDPDTDDDDLSDYDEVFVHGTNPILEDTDGGGAPDGIEVLIDGTDPLDPSDDRCIYTLDIDVNDATYKAAGPDFDPTWLRFNTAMLDTNFGLQEFWIDENQNLIADADEEFSSVFSIDLLGPEFEYICTVQFDATNATDLGTPSWTTPDGSTIFEAYEIASGTGATDCNSLDSAVYGDTDIRAVLDDLTWGIGLGELGDFRVGLEGSVIDQGLDWTNDWEPYVYGGWVSWDGTNATALNYGFTYDSACASVKLSGGDLVPVDAVTAAPLRSEATLRVTEPFLVVPFEDVTGIECDHAEEDITTTAYTPGTSTMAVTHIYFSLYGAIDEYGNLGDYYDDTGAAQSARVVANFYNVNFGTTDCSITFDASGATTVDTGDLTNVIDVAGNSSEIWHAFNLALEDGDGDCNALDPALGWTQTDPAALLASYDWIFGVGPTTTDLSRFVGADSDTHSLFVGAGGTTGTVTSVEFQDMLDADDCMVESSTGASLDNSVVASGAAGISSTSGLVYVFNPL